LTALLVVVGEAVVENSGYDFDAHDGECCVMVAVIALLLSVILWVQ
jgi:hypothetical protein